MKLAALLRWGTVILAISVLVGGLATTPGVWAQAGTWHVAVNGSDTTGNGSEAQPFATIQHGIDTASHGDTVLVHPGVYRENINFNSKNITVGSLFITTGDEDYILQTVIDGNRNGRVVTFVNGEAAAAKLSGFTITNGYAHGTSEPESYGGGIYTRYSSPTLTHLRVTGNEAVEEGGGLHIRDSSPTVRDIIVTNNHAGGGGGGIRYTGGSVSLENVVVTHNSARSDGAGIHFYHADGAIKNALIADNSGGSKGGGLGFDGCSPTFINATVVGNRTTGRGGGLNVSFMSQPTLVNSIVWGNSPEQIYFDTQWPGEALTVKYSDIEGGEAGIVTNGQGPVHWGDGNLDTSPRFVHAGLGNYRLADTSPGIGAGKADGAPITDIEGDPRPNPVGSNPDMGAYEHSLGSPETPTTYKLYLPFMVQSAPSAPPIDVIPGPALRVARAYHTATRLADGKILLVGGSPDGGWGLVDVEIFDPATGQTSRAAPLRTAQHNHTATLLPDGRVLIVGGYSEGWLNDAEVYEPSADTWTAVPPHHSHGPYHTATLMKDGRVLVVGGSIGSCQATERVEIFDPQTNSWTEAKSLEFSRGMHTAVLLDDGRVLVIGGWSTWKDCGSFPPDGDAMLYDPQTDSWTATGPMVTPRNFGASVRLPDGRVLVAGGFTYEDPVPKIWASTEIYDPASNTWTAAANLAQARYTHALTLLPDGQVLAVGGARDADYLWDWDSFVREIERYDPVANAWRIVGELPQPRAAATATLLPDGRVWLTGGRNDTMYFSDTWLIGPRTPAPPAPLLVQYDFEGDFLAAGLVIDRSGNGHDVQVTGVVDQAAGISGGQGIAFTGNGYLQAASNPAAGKTDVTFSLWFKTEHPEENYKLASGAWWNWGPGSGWIMATHGPEFWSDDTQGLLSPGQPNNENNFPSGLWVHEVVTYDGCRIKEYTNGQLINDWSTTGAGIGQGNPMVIGAWPPFTAYNFQGSMDEFRIYGRSLTMQEVQALYQQGR